MNQATLQKTMRQMVTGPSRSAGRPVVTAAIRQEARETARNIARDIFVKHAAVPLPTERLAAAAQASHVARKWHVSTRAVDAHFAHELVSTRCPREFWQKLGVLTPAQLRGVEALEPGIRDRFASEAREQQTMWMTALRDVLKSNGVVASGREKAWDRTLAKLDHWENLTRNHGFRATNTAIEPASILDLTDIARARIDLPAHRPTEMRRLVNDIKDALQERFPHRTLAFETRDSARRPTVMNAEAIYKGRIHLRVKDVTGGRIHGGFELQLGPRQLTRFWDTPFQTPGLAGSTNVHDAIYKGVSRLEQDPHLERLGRAFSQGTISAEHALNSGIAIVEQTIDLYQEALHDAMKSAIEGNSTTGSAGLARLHDRIGQIRKALQPFKDLPEGLLSPV